jgi:hypothetical protein
MTPAEKARRGRKPKNVCPRCGEAGGYFERRPVGNRIYYYFVHVKRQGPRRRVRKCYLGASRYVYVERFQNIGLAGLADEKRFERYVSNVAENLIRVLRERLEAARREEGSSGAT